MALIGNPMKSQSANAGGTLHEVSIMSRTSFVLLTNMTLLHEAKPYSQFILRVMSSAIRSRSYLTSGLHSKFFKFFLFPTIDARNYLNFFLETLEIAPLALGPNDSDVLSSLR